MFERFTDRARDVMRRAGSEAQRLRHDSVGTEHQLLALAKEGCGIAAELLRHANVDLDRMRRDLENLLTPGPPKSKRPRSPLRWLGHGERLPQTPRAKEVVEHAMEEARSLSHNYIGTEHLLLALMREQEGAAAQVLANLGLDLDDIRAKVRTLVGQESE